MRYIHVLLFTLAFLPTANAICCRCCKCCKRLTCVKATGQVQCQRDKTKEAGVEIYLMDHDVLSADDTMGYNTTNEDGTFVIEGCGYDLLSHPDPYLKIWSYCGTKVGKRIDTPVKQIFVPETANFGNIPLD